MIYVLSNTNFINWVTKKLNEHYYIDDKTSKLEEHDLFFANKLKTLYELIEDYANKKHIMATRIMDKVFYYVNYKDYVFFVYKSSNSYGCFNNTLNKKDLPYCINYEMVRDSKMEELSYLGNSLFDDIRKDIIKLHDKGYSLEFINQTILKITSNIKNNDRGFTYKKGGKK